MEWSGFGNTHGNEFLEKVLIEKMSKGQGNKIELYRNIDLMKEYKHKMRLPEEVLRPKGKKFMVKELNNEVMEVSLAINEKPNPSVLADFECSKNMEVFSKYTKANGYSCDPHWYVCYNSLF